MVDIPFHGKLHQFVSSSVTSEKNLIAFVNACNIIDHYFYRVINFERKGLLNLGVGVTYFIFSRRLQYMIGYCDFSRGL